MFKQANYGTDKAPGLKAGREYAFGLLRESIGWGVIFVAGMEYASYVQGKGFSTLDTAEMIVEKSLADALKQIVI